MKITFLIIKDYRQYHSLSSGPIGLAYLSAAAKRAFPEIEIQIEVDPQQVLKSRPDIIGVSAYTETYSQSIEAVQWLRTQIQVPIWLGGPHINALPQTLDPCFELGVIGEGEETFVELIDLYLKNDLYPEKLKNIAGLVYWDNNEIKQTAPREVIQELDQILRPDRSIMHTYWPPNQERIKWPEPIYTSRGCPFKCIFCIYSVITQKVRYHSVERVVSEIEDIIRLNPTQETITIHDDLFALSKKRLRHLVKGIREAGIHRKVSFICMAKASIFDHDMALLFRDMNVSVVTFGFESGVQRLLEYLKGPRNKVQENTRAIEACAHHGIRVGGYFIVGTPIETYQELQQSYWYIRKNYPPMSMAGIFRLTPFPGTKFWQEAIEKGIVKDKNNDWTLFNYADYEKKDYLYANPSIPLDTFKAAYQKFTDLMERNGLAPSLEEQEKSIIHLQDSLFTEFLSGLNVESKILEISGFTSSAIQNEIEAQELELSLTRVTPWLWEQDSEEKYDWIICNFSLEQTATPLTQIIQKLHRALSSGGRMLIFMYNPQHMSVLIRLLTGSWDSLYWGFRPFDLLRFYSLKQIQSTLKLVNLNIHECHAFHSTSLDLQQQELIKLLNQFINGGAGEALKHFAYTVLTTPKEESKSYVNIQSSSQYGQSRIQSLS